MSKKKSKSKKSKSNKITVFKLKPKPDEHIEQIIDAAKSIKQERKQERRSIVEKLDKIAIVLKDSGANPAYRSSALARIKNILVW